MVDLIEKEGKYFKECNVVMLPTKDRTTIIINTYINETHNIDPLLTIEASKQYLAAIMSHDNTDALIERGLQPQHLYITSDDKIKEGDWVYCNNFGKKEILQVYKKEDNLFIDIFDEVDGTISTTINKFDKKIIATTDKSLLIGKITKTENANIGNYKTLPQIPQTFIEEYCKEGGIDKVLVEFTKMNRCCGRCDGIDDLCWVDQQCDKHNNTDCNECFPPKGDIVKLKTDSHNTITIKPVEEKMYSREEVRELCINAWAVGFKVGINPKDNGSEQDWLKENL